jgi:hypothetical protein
VWYFAEGAAHPPRVVSTDIDAVVLIVISNATAERVEVESILWLLEHEREVVQVKAAIKVFVLAELGGFLVATDSDGAELDGPAVLQSA